MNDWLLRPTLAKGLIACSVVALFILLLGLALFHFPYGLLIGAIAGAFAWVALWNAGVLQIPINNRALLVLLGTRQDGSEIGEGLHWIVPGLMSIGKIYDMREQTFIVADVPIHTGDKVVTKVNVSIQWATKEGALYDFNNVADINAAFKSEVQQAVRAYSISKGGIDNLIALDSGETLKFMIMDYLKLRSSGHASKIKVGPAGTVEYESDTAAKPWGLDIRSVAVTGFDLNQDITHAATRPEIARADKVAAEILRQGIIEAIDALRRQGLDPVIALEESNLLLLPDRSSPPVRRWSVTGLDGTIKTLIDGALIAMGKSGLPENVTPLPQPQTSPIGTGTSND